MTARRGGVVSSGTLLCWHPSIGPWRCQSGGSCRCDLLSGLALEVDNCRPDVVCGDLLRLHLGHRSKIEVRERGMMSGVKGLRLPTEEPLQCLHLEQDVALLDGLELQLRVELRHVAEELGQLGEAQ